MNINELEKLAKAVPGWSNCNKAWLDTSEDVSAAVVGHINEDGECYPVITVDCDQYYSGDSLNLAKFYAAANQSAILELIAAYREAVAALKKSTRELDACQSVIWQAADYGFDPTYVKEAKGAIKNSEQALATAKRLVVE